MSVKYNYEGLKKIKIIHKLFWLIDIHIWFHEVLVIFLNRRKKSCLPSGPGVPPPPLSGSTKKKFCIFTYSDYNPTGAQGLIVFNYMLIVLGNRHFRPNKQLACTISMVEIKTNIYIAFM